MSTERINQNFKIIQSVIVGDSEFVLGENIKVSKSFVTWQCKDGDNYFWGHYMNDILSAQKDLYKRAIVEIEKLQERHQEREYALDIQPLKTEEILYTEKQSMQLDGQTGCIGYLGGSFGESGDFQSEWTDRWEERKTDEFAENLGKVITSLASEHYGLLECHENMKAFEFFMPVSTFERKESVRFSGGHGRLCVSHPV